ncbi:MAG TPA: hypothetical protein VMF31_10915 [Solirubrobacterales bacterium]|nr:hypothetical protein [Solirubrobacterales bacterium]
MEIVYVLILGAAVAAFVSYPFWGRSEASTVEDPALAGLEAARESKYREIRDAEADLASGKLSQEDFDQVNADLRRDAVAILKDLDAAREEAGEAPGESDDPAPDPGDSSPKSGDS